MWKRDLKVGAIGALLAAIVITGGYKGVRAVHAASSNDSGASAELRAGEAGRLGMGGTSDKARDGSSANREGDDDGEADPTQKANNNLVAQVSDYRSRLQAVSAEKAELEAKLKRSEERLAASQDGSTSSAKHDFDVGPEEWKELAKDGTIKFQMPCFDTRGGWSPSPEKLHNLGLAPSDGATIKNAYAHTNKEVWAQIKPLCAQAVGSADVAERIGPDTCIHLVLDIESERDKDGVKEARKQVGEIRAGERPMPNLEDKNLNPVLKLFLAATGASKTLENDLAQSFGPEEAHRIVYSDELCMGSSIFGGRRPKK